MSNFSLLNQNSKLVGNSIAECDLELDETEDAKIIKAYVDWDMWNRLFFQGDWKCFGGSDNPLGDFVSCNARSSKPFLHSFPMTNPVDCQLRGGLEFWPCLELRKCVRKGQVCEMRISLRPGAKCQYGYRMGSDTHGERYCSRKICPNKKLWPCKSQ